MIYIGFVIDIDEAIRLLNFDEYRIDTFYHTEPIQMYLKNEGSQLKFFYIDKGACLFGLPVDTKQTNNDSTLPYTTVDETVIAILNAKKEFLAELDSLHISTKTVNITWIEGDNETSVANPEPYVISI